MERRRMRERGDKCRHPTIFIQIRKNGFVIAFVGKFHN
jgi:hypothetical protein